MSQNVLLIALGEDSVADVRQGRIGEAGCAFAARIDLNDADDTLAAMARESLTIVLVPTRRVALRTTEFQGKPRQATPLALAWAHESGLLEEVEQMHWALLGREQTRYGVAGVALTQMQAWQALLTARGIRADKMLPDALALTARNSPVRWRDGWRVRSDDWQGAQLPASWPEEMLPQASACCSPDDGPDPAAPRAAAVADDALWAVAEEAWRSPITLLQGAFRPARRRSPRPGKTACALLLAAAALLVSGLHHQRSGAHAERQIAALYQRQLPGGALPADPIRAAGKKIALMQRALREPQLFRLLPRAVAELAARQAPPPELMTFDAATGQLEMTFLSDGAALPASREEHGVGIAFRADERADRTILTLGDLP